MGGSYNKGIKKFKGLLYEKEFRIDDNNFNCYRISGM